MKLSSFHRAVSGLCVFPAHVNPTSTPKSWTCVVMVLGNNFSLSLSNSQVYMNLYADIRLQQSEFIKLSGYLPKMVFLVRSSLLVLQLNK